LRHERLGDRDRLRRLRNQVAGIWGVRTRHCLKPLAGRKETVRSTWILSCVHSRPGVSSIPMTPGRAGRSRTVAEEWLLVLRVRRARGPFRSKMGPNGQSVRNDAVPRGWVRSCFNTTPKYRSATTAPGRTIAGSVAARPGVISSWMLDLTAQALAQPTQRWRRSKDEWRIPGAATVSGLVALGRCMSRFAIAGEAGALARRCCRQMRQVSLAGHVESPALQDTIEP
jgi:hypothetical protein